MNNVVFIIPTGIGCAIGGHAGDATPAAKLIARSCDRLILHPNVVNASDINEMPANALYVEGSTLDRFLEGTVCLNETVGNRILVMVNAPVGNETINAVNAAITTIGAQIQMVELNTPLKMEGWITDGVANGSWRGVDDLIIQSQEHEFDALAIATEIEVDPELAKNYLYGKDLVNPWGWIEAKVSRLISISLNKPVAHAPIESASTKDTPELNNLPFCSTVDRRKAAEVISNCYLHCVLKGLHKAPRLNGASSPIFNDTVRCMVTPWGCIGRPHEACLKAGIPVIAVLENHTALHQTDRRFIHVKNYLEASGMVNCIMAGLNPYTVRGDR